MSHRFLVAAWSTGMIFWCVLCAVGWTVATRGDYARLAAARACYPTDAKLQSASAQCAGVKPSDIPLYKAAIDRKAAISRLGATFGCMVLAISLIVTRRAGTRNPA
jgi:hypothetical protein